MRLVLNAHNHKYICLVIFLIIASFVTYLFVSTPGIALPAVASDTASRWVKVNTPTTGEMGGWALAPGSDIQCLTMASDGTLYACGAGLDYTLLKSSDGGITWSSVGQVQNLIIGIAVSPQNPGILYYTTNTTVYRSADGGTSFIQLPVPGGAGMSRKEITSIAAGWLNGSIIAASTRDADSGEWGGVYLYDESATVPAWVDAGIGNYDVYRVAFSPGYTNDQQIIAVATDETNSYVFNRTGTSGWNAFIGPAQLFRDNTGNPAAVAIGRSAAIAFPDDYTAAADTPGFFYVGIDTGAGLGDVFKITCLNAPSASTAQDLNISGSQGVIDIHTLAARGESGSVLLTAGAANDSRVYTSTDGGNSWKKSLKSPTGNGINGIQFSPDFNANGVIYAATTGTGSAFSISRDAGSTWNQISLIDTSIDMLIEIAGSPSYSLDNTLFMITSGAGSKELWRTANAGSYWERILSRANPAVDIIDHIGLPPDYGAGGQTIFACGESGGNPVIWSSDDNGQSFRSRFTRDRTAGAPFPIDAMAVIDENDLLISSYNGVHGMVYRTNNRGFTFSPGVPAGSQSIHSLMLSPDFLDDGTIIIGNSAGGVYRSVDGGASFSPLPADGTIITNSGTVHVAFDPAYKENRTIYVAGDNADAGFYRLDTADDAGWVSLNSTLPSGSTIDSIAVSGSGILYGVNSQTDGGLERCLDPRARTPVFEAVTNGLSAGATLVGICQTGNRIWAIDSANGKLMTYNDTLTTPVVPDRPVDTASGTGNLVNHVVKDVTISWETMTGATDYTWQCTDTKDFSSIPTGLQGTVTGNAVRLPALDPATVYYWRVRASAPALSPWSATRSFTTSLDTQVVELKPESPTAGDTGVALKPVFQWTAVIGASSYELLVATDTDFNNPVVIKIGDYVLNSNVWECDTNLDYQTTYYWKVRAVTASTHSGWSSTGVFMTLERPAALTEKSDKMPDVHLLDNQEKVTTTPNNVPRPSPSPSPAALPTASAPPTVPPAATVSQLADIPAWMLYFIGGLLAIVMLSLLIVLAVVMKIKRF